MISKRCSQAEFVGIPLYLHGVYSIHTRYVIRLHIYIYICDVDDIIRSFNKNHVKLIFHVETEPFSEVCVFPPDPFRRLRLDFFEMTASHDSFFLFHFVPSRSFFFHY